MWAKGIFVTLLVLVSGSVAAKTCNVTVEGNDAMSFNTQEIKVEKDCTEVELTLKHTGRLPKTAMGHTVVITRTADYKDVAKAGGKLSAADNYVPKGDARVLASTALVGGGESTSVKIDMSKFKAGEDYTFFCTFPGHWSVMKGKFIFG